jgi:Calcineurin-like phosphoesterase
MRITWSSDPNVAERQMQAVIFCLVAFGYIDSDFDRSEKGFIRDLIGRLVADRASAAPDDATRKDLAGKWTNHYQEVMDEMDRDILCHFSESVVEGETTHGFVLAKLKLGAFELLRQFDDDARTQMLGVIDEMMHADGTVHPNEQAFRDELAKLLTEEVELDDNEIVAIEEGRVVIDQVRKVTARVDDHPFLKPFEWDFADDPETFAAQAAGDMDLIGRVNERLAEQRKVGNGKLRGAESMSSFFGEPPFLDQHVYVFQPNPAREIELLVLGDLHGCYSCLKAALMQADFFRKVEAYKADPENNVAPYVVLLGDYIDRGRFSYAGTLRAVMQMYASFPEHVFLLRGNHEYYVELKGQVLAPVRPSEAMDSIRSKASKNVLSGYMNLFEAMPNMLIFDKTLFVHGGIPRDRTLENKWEGLHSLNDKEMRFEMLWSDPSDADSIPDDLQAENARFPFGRKQFSRFMNKIACHTMIRGHERVREGFRTIYDGDEGTLVTLFSAGGKRNDDLPPTSNYREVTPMALTIRYADGVSTLTPFAIDYARYNKPEFNSFFKKAVG